MNGKSSTSGSPSAFMRRITAAIEVRRISGSVNAGRASKPCSSYRRMQTPGPSRPQRPARWFAAARDTGSTCSISTLLRKL